MARRRRRSFWSGERDDGFPAYVSVAERQANAAREVAKLSKKGKPCAPVVIAGRAIATTFWGKAWCTHFESLGDFANRLPRGRTYVRNGSVVDLRIEQGVVHSLVSGSSLYKIRVEIGTLPAARWANIVNRCNGEIGSIIELLQGKLADGVMKVITERDEGLFPRTREIAMSCSCPDYATMCKHVAATLYAVGARLDDAPGMLFTLRGVDQSELIAADAVKQVTGRARRGDRVLDGEDLGAMFGIEVAEETSVPKRRRAATGRTAKEAVSVQSTNTAPVAKKKTVAKSAKPAARLKAMGTGAGRDARPRRGETF